MWWLIVLSVLALFLGLNYLTQATLGVGIIGIACYFGIVARIAQAHQHARAAYDVAQQKHAAQAGEDTPTEDA